MQNQRSGVSAKKSETHPTKTKSLNLAISALERYFKNHLEEDGHAFEEAAKDYLGYACELTQAERDILARVIADRKATTTTSTGTGTQLDLFTYDQYKHKYIPPARAGKKLPASGKKLANMLYSKFNEGTRL